MTTLEQALPATRSSSPVGYRASGTSPPTLHLLGLGQVGRAFLAQLDTCRCRLVAVTDSRATVHDRNGLDPARLLGHERSSGALRAWNGAATIPSPLAVALVGAEVVVDATATDLRDPGPAVARCAAALANQSALVLAAKDALHADTMNLLRHGARFDAVLGGTGAALRRERDALRAAASVALVPNASTTALIERLERGAAWDAAVAESQRLGVLESDPSLDVEGHDAFVKLAIVLGVLWQVEPTAGTLRADLRRVDPELLRWRARRGRTTRLVARGGPDGFCRLGYEEVDRGSPLGVPSDRVAYTYQLADGRQRVHVGFGIGPERTAAALHGDVLELCGNGGGR